MVKRLILRSHNIPMNNPSNDILPFDRDNDQPRTYFLDEVEVDECYEVVVSQPWSGIYRYRLGDVVQISGYHENCPTFRFMYR